MFSGVYPTRHGYLDGGMPFHPPHDSLAERLQKEGYYTFGAARNGHIDSDKEVTNGFGEYGDIYRFPKTPRSLSDLKSHYYALAPGYARVAYRMLRADRKPSEYVSCEYIRKRILKGASPFFGFVNINSPHTPYAPPEPFRSRFQSFDEDGVDLDLVKSLAHVDGRGSERYIAGEIDPSEEVWEAVQDWYDGEIRFADALVKRLVDTLRSANLYDETLIIITGDHGEHFGEHGRAAHQFSLFDELLHVPLIIKPATNGTVETSGIENGRVVTEGLVSLVDLYPTILSELGLSVPDTVAGLDIFGSDSRDVIFAEYGEPRTAMTNLENHTHSELSDEIRDEVNHPLQCVRTDDRKYIRVLGGEDKVYAITGGSPKETLLPHDRGDDLRALLAERLGTDLAVTEPGTLDDKTRENLKELGYL